MCELAKSEEMQLAVTYSKYWALGASSNRPPSAAVAV